MNENFDALNSYLDHEDRLDALENKIGKAEKLLILIVGLQFPNVLTALGSAGLI